jgi:hypothetical protein
VQFKINSLTSCFVSSQTPNPQPINTALAFSASLSRFSILLLLILPSSVSLSGKKTLSQTACATIGYML